MRNILRVSALVTFCFQKCFGLNFQDLMPIKHDVSRVRDESKILKNSYMVLDFIGLVERHNGYTAEEHFVTTNDGYHLTMHRITGSPSSPKASGKPVVFLQHGILMSSDGFVLNGPGKDLAFLLADAGFDVWLGNARGNTYSRSHSKLKPSESKFWDFSWHEIGMFDLPTFIDYTLKKTDKKNLMYIGYSMGTTASYVLLSRLPQYNEKISLVISLAPIAFWTGNLPPFMKFAVDNFNLIENFVKGNHYFEVMPQSTYTAKLAKVFCSNPNQPFNKNPCSLIFEHFVPIFDLSRSKISYPEYFKYSPAGSSAKTFLHYLQNASKKKFQEYNSGIDKEPNNLPLIYNLTRVTAPVILFYSSHDYFSSSSKNVEMLIKQLPNVIDAIQVPRQNFNHLDFFVADGIKELLYDSIIESLQSFRSYSIHYYKT